MIKKILNKNVANVVDESLTGFLLAYKKYYKRVGDYNGFVYRNRRKNKVALVIGGGSGHEPLFSGFCGKGMADGVACGNVCASPNPELIKAVGREVNEGKGVLFMYGCYAGDNLNFDMAEEALNKEGIKTAHVRVQDDFLSAPIEKYNERRGIAGDVFDFKIAGAACDAGLSLEEVVKVTEKCRNLTNTVGVCTLPCTLPGNPGPAFTINDDEMVIGMGLHGEKGLMTCKMAPCNEIVKQIYDLFKERSTIKDQLKDGCEVAVMVNGLGSTTLLELNLVYLELYKLLHNDGIVIHDAEVKNYCTSMEMGGFSITLLPLDEELKKYYDMPAFTPFYAKGEINASVNQAEIEEEEIEFDENDIEKITIIRSKTGKLEELNSSDTRNMLLYVADEVIAQKEYLTQIDSAIGDGDHGIGMCGGMQKVKKKLSKMVDETNCYKLFEEAGLAMLNSMGGASGVIFGSLYLEGARDNNPTSILTVSDLADMEEASLLNIQKRGGAQKGDKTMVDALIPVVEALKAHKDDDLLTALVAAENGAKQGVEDTKNYVAKFGRSKSLKKEDVLGHQDAGATSVYLIFKAMREFVEGNI